MENKKLEFLSNNELRKIALETSTFGIMGTCSVSLTCYGGYLTKSCSSTTGNCTTGGGNYDSNNKYVPAYIKCDNTTYSCSESTGSGSNGGSGSGGNGSGSSSGGSGSGSGSGGNGSGN